MAERTQSIAHGPMEVVAAMEVPQVSAEAHIPTVPTLHDAFLCLAEALAARYADDNMPLYLRCQELRIVHANGNIAYAWTHLITVLEQALGVPLRTL